MHRMDGKTCLVSGGAMGIGAACIRLFHAQGANVVIADIAREEGEAFARELGERALFVPLDVRSDADWTAAIEATRARFGRLDVLVNNAGISEGGTIESTSEALWQRTMAINADGVFLGCRHAVAAMKDHGGSIVNISSSLGIRANEGHASYGASKAAVRSLTKSVALHCGRSGYGIRCNSVHPGAIRTPMFGRFVAQAPTPEEGEQAFAAVHPLGRIGKPDDIANAVLFLASDEANFVTAAELTVDGGASYA